MTTNKPGIEIYEPSEKGVTAMRKASFRNTGLNRYVRLSDYERLQAECEKLRKHLQNLIDQTTPLEPVPGNPMWSRRIQLDEVIAERDQLRAECEKLRKNLVLAGRWVPAPDPSCKCDDCVADAKLVAAIDAAMEGDKP